MLFLFLNLLWLVCFYFMCKGVLAHTYVCVLCVGSTCRSQSQSPLLGVTDSGGHHVDAENGTWVLRKSSSALNHGVGQQHGVLHYTVLSSAHGAWQPCPWFWPFRLLPSHLAASGLSTSEPLLSLWLWCCLLYLTSYLSTPSSSATSPPLQPSHPQLLPVAFCWWLMATTLVTLCADFCSWCGSVSHLLM